MTDTNNKLKEKAQQRLLSVQDKISNLSHQIHDHPEVSLHEINACKWLSDFLEEDGFHVERGVAGLSTSFVAKKGTGDLHVAFCVEYDALPEIGHACGHNINATACIGAGIALSAVASETDLTVYVIGTPGEEAGGGKIILLEKGIFDNIHAAMMVHAAPIDVLNLHVSALQEFETHYYRQEGNLSSNPEDALILAATAIGLLRRYLLATDRITGVIMPGANDPETISQHGFAKYIIRSSSTDRLLELTKAALNCFEGVARATGTKLEIIYTEKTYLNLKQDQEILSLYKTNAEALGRTFAETANKSNRWELKLIKFFLRQINVSLSDAVKAILVSKPSSTDMGNISLKIPSIHPAIGINSSLLYPIHHPKFAEATITSDADKAILDGALALAWTAIDIAQNNHLRNRLLKHQNEHEK